VILGDAPVGRQLDQLPFLPRSQFEADGAGLIGFVDEQPGVARLAQRQIRVLNPTSSMLLWSATAGMKAELAGLSHRLLDAFSPRATILKILLGLTVFSAIVGGWLVLQHRVKMHTPLPDAEGPQGGCVLWFIGSSSIHRWVTLEQDMRPWISHNRGVEGAMLPELRQRFANEKVSARPDAMVFYVGNNDIADRKSAAETAAQFRQLVATEMAKMPGVPMFTISVKPSPTRWPLRDVQVAFDQHVRQLAMRLGNLIFVDASAGLLSDGRPGPFFLEDGVHLNPAGYRVWAGAIHDALVEHLPAPATQHCAKGRPTPLAKG
jgi:hypothetical protein